MGLVANAIAPEYFSYGLVLRMPPNASSNRPFSMIGVGSSMSAAHPLTTACVARSGLPAAEKARTWMELLPAASCWLQNTWRLPWNRTSRASVRPVSPCEVEAGSRSPAGRHRGRHRHQDRG